MEYSISAHFGKKMSRDHNVRNRKITDSEAHINKDGYFKILQDMPVKQAYYKVFGNAVLEYNAKQKRTDRQILDYHTKVLDAYRRDPKRNPATSQEVIFTIGNVKHHPSIGKSEEILTDFLDRFKKANPNVHVFGAYFHADEPGSAPHMHVDYILIKRQNKRGLSIQVGQEGALKEMGYFTTGSKKNKDLITAQTRWQSDQRELLRKITQEHGLEVQEAKNENEKAYHLDTEIFKRTAKLSELDQEIKENQMWAENTRQEAKDEQEKLARTLKKQQESELVIKLNKARLDRVEKLEKENKELKSENSLLKQAVNILQQALDIAEDWLSDIFFGKDKKKENSLWNRFKQKLTLNFDKESMVSYNSVRHDPTLNTNLAQQEKEFLEGESRNAPATPSFGYDPLIDNEHDFHKLDDNEQLDL